MRNHVPRPIRLLLVDDEASDRTTMSAALKAAGYDVLEAESYREAIARAAASRTKVKLLIADISLPDGNGCSLALAVKAQQPALRVLFVSGHVGAEVCQYYGLHVDDLHFLKKPFTSEQLLDRVRHVLTSDYAFPRLSLPKTRAS